MGAAKGGGPEGWGPRRVGAPKGGGPEGWGPKPRKSGGPKGGGPKVGGPKVGGPEGGGPKISRFFFPSPAAKFVLFFPLWGSSRGILGWCLKRRLKCARLEFSGCRVRAPAARSGGAAGVSGRGGSGGGGSGGGALNTHTTQQQQHTTKLAKSVWPKLVWPKSAMTAAPGPSGMTSEHLRPLLSRPADLHWLFRAGEQLARGEAPEVAVEAIHMGRMTALQKPDGGVRGIVAGDVMRRLVGRTVAQQILQRGSSECLASYLDHVPPLDESVFRALKQEDALNRKRRKNLGLTDLHADLPVVRVAGPTLPPPLPATLALCQTKLVIPHLEVQFGKYDLQHIPVPRPSVQCGQFILCPFVQDRREGDFQAHVESLFAKEGMTLAVLSPHGDSSSFNVDLWVSLIKSGRVIALYISLSMRTWNPLQGPPQQVRSMRELWGVSGLALVPFKCVRAANFTVQTSLLLMLAARAARVPALWCHPSPVEGELSPSLWHLPEVQWTLNAEVFHTDRIDSCTFWVQGKGPCHCLVHQPSVCRPDCG